MKKTLFAIYERESRVPYYCRSAWVYAREIVKIECLFLDYSEERKLWEENGWYWVDKDGNIIPNEERRPDVYVVRTTNARGVVRDNSTKTKEEANRMFKALVNEFKDFRRVR